MALYLKKNVGKDIDKLKWYDFAPRELRKEVKNVKSGGVRGALQAVGLGLVVGTLMWYPASQEIWKSTAWLNRRLTLKKSEEVRSSIRCCMLSFLLDTEHPFVLQGEAATTEEEGPTGLNGVAQVCPRHDLDLHSRSPYRMLQA